jgi:hypothetical protein
VLLVALAALTGTGAILTEMYLNQSSPGSADAEGSARKPADQHQGYSERENTQAHVSPLVVKISPAREQLRESAEIADDRRDHAAREGWIVGLTALLTIATIALGVFTYLLFRATAKAVQGANDALARKRCLPPTWRRVHGHDPPRA